MTTVRDIERYRTDTVADEFSLTDSDGAAKDITDYTFLFVLSRREDPEDDSFHVLTIEGTIIDAATGRMDVPWEDADANQVPAIYFYSIKSVDPDGKLSTVCKGEYEFLAIPHQV